MTVVHIQTEAFIISKIRVHDRRVAVSDSPTQRDRP
jgi:hypothetical protein